jgi:hypothetical protein
VGLIAPLGAQELGLLRALLEDADQEIVPEFCEEDFGLYGWFDDQESARPALRNLLERGYVMLAVARMTEDDVLIFEWPSPEQALDAISAPTAFGTGNWEIDIRRHHLRVKATPNGRAALVSATGLGPTHS